MIDLNIQIGKNLKLANPILTASGTCGYGEELNEIVDIENYGGIITKSLSLNPRSGNPPPRITETPAGMINSIGLANIGVDNFLEQKSELLQNYSGTKIINLAGKTINEFIQIIDKLESENWIDGYEINVSCPNVKEGGVAFGTDPNILSNLIGTIQNETNKFLIVKLSPNVTDIQKIALSAQKAGADAVSLVNTFYGASIDIHTREPEINSVIGGLSGPAIKPAALAKVIKVSQVLDIPIIGIGGISSGEDVIEFMLAGASAVELGTVHFTNPKAILQIKKFLTNYCKKHKLKRVSDIIGQAKI